MLWCFGRFWIELLRIDPANHILGLRVNTWVSGLGFVAGLIWLVLSQTGWAAEEKAHAEAAEPSCRAEDGRPRQAASGPAARVAAWPVPSAISSWTSTPSRARSTCC